MNIVVIGGNNGFGYEIVQMVVNEPEFRDCTLLVTGRDLDLSNGQWVSKLKDKLIDTFGDPMKVDVVILAAYVRSTTDNVQMNVAHVLYQVYKKTLTQLILIGDIAHHATPKESMYHANKRDLWLNAMEWGRDTSRVCPILLYEPNMNGFECASEMAAYVNTMGPGDFLCVSAINRSNFPKRTV